MAMNAGRISGQWPRGQATWLCHQSYRHSKRKAAGPLRTRRLILPNDFNTDWIEKNYPVEMAK
jgi:hypothetical protein